MNDRVQNLSTYGGYGGVTTAEQRNKVMRNTYWLLALSMIPTVLGAWVGLEMGRAGAAASVTTISPAGLWRAPIGPRRRDFRAWAQGARPLLRLALRVPALRRRMLATFAAHPERIPAAAGRELVLGWVDSDGYEGANRAMREHVFEPAGYPPEVPVTIAWCERDRLVGPAQQPQHQ